jgi:phosphoribosylformylglycinamidine cyclo-ligase
MARWQKNQIITNEKIKPGDVIVGFASDGQATYEKEYNSGIGSNGLTSARHDILDKSYGRKFPETFEPSLKDEVVYIGKHKLSDAIDVQIGKNEYKSTIGKLILSPTRTYAPLMKILLEQHFNAIHGAIHCSGGGQTKCMKYLPQPLRIIKDDLFEPPVIFQLIQQNSGADDKEMYQVFNMGHRLEIFTDKISAGQLIDVAEQFDIPAKVVGRVETSEKKELILKMKGKEIVY